MEILASLKKDFPKIPCVDLTSMAAVLLPRLKSKTTEPLTLPSSQMIIAYDVQTFVAAGIVPEPMAFSLFRLPRPIEIAFRLGQGSLDVRGQMFIKVEGRSGFGEIRPSFIYSDGHLKTESGAFGKPNWINLVAPYFAPIATAISLISFDDGAVKFAEAQHV